MISNRRASNSSTGALQRLESLLQAAPGNRAAHLLLGQLLFRQGAFAAALPHLQQACAGSTDAAAHNQLGQALQAMHRLDAAIACYRRVTELAPSHPSGHANLAAVWLERGNTAGAIQACRQALAVAPDFVGAHLLLASACYRAGEFEAALAGYQRVLELEPGSVMAAVGRAQMLARLGRSGEATDAVDALLERGVRDHVLAAVFAQPCGL